MTAGVINWLCHACALTAIVGALLYARRSMNAATRYLIWWATLVLVLAMPGLAFIPSRATDFTAFQATLSPSPQWSLLVLKPLPHLLLVLLIVAWLLWVSVSIARIAIALLWLTRTKTTLLPMPDGVEQRLHVWMTLRGRGRPTRLALSDRIRSPSVLGLWAPVITLPLATLDDLSDDELDQVVVHEYAHVQRRDDLSICLQRLIHAVAGMHPAVWWIDRSLTLEREIACDEWTVFVTGSRKRYAACLARIAIAMQSRDALTVAPGVAQLRPHLSARIARLLDDHHETEATRPFVTMVSALPALTCLSLGLSVVTAVSVEYAAPAATIDARMARNETSPVGSVDAADSMTRLTTPIQQSHPAIGLKPSGRSATPNLTLQLHTIPKQYGPSVSATPNLVNEQDTSHLVARRYSHDLGRVLPSVAGIREPGIEESAEHQWLQLESSVVTSPWIAAANAGTAIGIGTRKAGVKTAGLFTRFGKSVAGAF